MSFTINDLKSLRESKEFTDSQQNKNLLYTIGEKIYARRKDLGLTQHDLAERCGIKQNKISELEHGIYGKPSLEYLSRIADSLSIKKEYLTSTDIDRKTFELFDFFIKKLHGAPDAMQLMKIPYFIDLELIKFNLQQATNFDYIRYNYGPFDAKMYTYAGIFSYENYKGFEKIKYNFLTEREQEIILNLLTKLPINNSTKLKKDSYETEPMKRLGVKLGDNKKMGVPLDINCV